MSKIYTLIIALLLLSSCEAIKKPELTKPFSKCPPQDERTLKDIFCRE
tara:strand:- start:856 stop:999 length:144 start_codon:yes stop_codon:yes gene_type:complete